MSYAHRWSPLQGRRSAPLLSFALLGILVWGCAVNPATGRRQFVLMSESQEIQLGTDSDVDITASLGLVADSALQRYVSGLGARMAQASERPDLPWTFRVVDDPVVNAFALPGGYIYITRGILTHFSSEAELAGVLGHEIGHVTARHGVTQMSRAQVLQIGLGVGSILAPDLAPYAELAGAGFQLLLLSYGRDAEREADGLGLRYMTGQGYDPREMAATFEMLADASGAEDGERIPGFLSTHPDPLSRRDEILQRAASGEVSGSTVEREGYLRRIEGLVFGPNPREGYFEEQTFLHPDLAFRLDFPAGWARVNEKSAVRGSSPEGDALIVLTLEEGVTTARAARDRFLQGEGVSGANLRDQPVNGLPSSAADFTATSQDGTLQGVAAFVQHGENIYRILGFAVAERWSARGAALRSGVGSFRAVTDRAVLDVQPSRIRLVRIPNAMTLEQFHAAYPSSVPIEQIGTINRLDSGETAPAGTLLKRVTAAP